MPVPRRRHSTARRDRARTHKKLTANLGANCPQCGAPTLQHRICASCGNYKDRVYIVKVTAE